jgi:hypothetical protein
MSVTAEGVWNGIWIYCKPTDSNYKHLFYFNNWSWNGTKSAITVAIYCSVVPALTSSVV